MSDKQPITNVNQFIEEISKLAQEAERNGNVLLFRGQDDAAYRLIPGVFREYSYQKNEHTIFKELVSYYPGEFDKNKNTFEKLVRAQHFGLPTRLLDITFNPLVALYFSIGNIEKNKENGKVFILTVEKDAIKYYDSDTLSSIANLVYLKPCEKENIKYDYKKNLYAQPEEFCKNQNVKKLIHFIKDERPYFEDRIVPRDLFKVIPVKAKMNNERIASQSGAFLAFGLDYKDLEMLVNKSNMDDIIKIDTLIIDKDSKKRIKEQLDLLSINEASLFPDISGAAEYIKWKYDK